MITVPKKYFCTHIIIEPWCHIVNNWKLHDWLKLRGLSPQVWTIPTEQPPLVGEVTDSCLQISQISGYYKYQLEWADFRSSRNIVAAIYSEFWWKYYINSHMMNYYKRKDLLTRTHIKGGKGWYQVPSM
jgi:hypothetical protein